MSDVEIDQLLSYELAGGDYGAEHVFSGFAAQLADQPLAHSLAEIAIASSDEATVDFYKRFAVCIVPHRLALMRRKGLSEPISVGLEIEYLNGTRTCSVVGLFPSPEFQVVGGLETEFAASCDFGGNMSTLSEADTVLGASVMPVGSLRLTTQTKLKSFLNVRCKVQTPKIMSVGIGSQRCEWRFDLADQPLYGKDIEAWSFVVLPKRQSEITYKMRFYVVTRLVFVPQRFQSGWETVTAKILSVPVSLRDNRLSPLH